MNAKVLEIFLGVTPQDNVQATAPKIAQVQELLEEVRDSLVPAPNNFYRTSTIIEPEEYNTIKNLI